MTERKPPPGKGDDVQRDYTEDIETYWFRWADQWWELPHRKMLDFKKVLRTLTLQDKVNDITADNVEDLIKEFDGVFLMLMGPEQGAEFLEVEDRPIEFLMDTLKRWRAHSGETEEDRGEFSASDDSSKSTGRPSKRTSSGSTASGSAKPSSRKPRKTATPRASSSSASAG
jgi:hypothetical protein